MAYRVTLIPGDGIGPELAEATRRVLDASGVAFEWEVQDAGEAVMAEYGTPLPGRTCSSPIRRNRVALKGPITTPVGSGFRSVNVTLRQTLGLYANLRPARSIKGLETRYDDVDLVIVRENTEDLYAGIEHMVGPDAAESIKIITRAASERIARFAFDYAVANGRRKVTAVHKANIMKLSDGLFLESCRTVAADYEGRVEFEDRIVDNMCMQLVQKPDLYDVLVLPNLYGDIVSDLCAGLVGGLGVAPGANIGTEASVFEPVHGSAPKYAGQDKANPTAMILSGVLMLRHLGEQPAAERVEDGGPRRHRRGQAHHLRPRRQHRHPRLRGRDHRAARRDRRRRLLTARTPASPRPSARCSCATAAARGCSRGRSTGSRASRSGCSSCSTSSTSGWPGSNPTLYDDVLRVYASPIGRVLRGAARRGAAVPRAQRPADHHHGLLAPDDPLPPAAVVRGAGSCSSSPGSPSRSRSWRRPSGSRRRSRSGDEMPRVTRSGSARPQGSGFELAVWYGMRLTGLGLFVTALAHYLITHFLSDPANQNAAWIQDRWGDIAWRTIDWLMLTFVVFHAFMGLRTVVGDYTSGGVRTALTMALYLGAIVLFAMGTIVVATLPFPAP